MNEELTEENIGFSGSRVSTNDSGDHDNQGSSFFLILKI